MLTVTTALGLCSGTSASTSTGAQGCCPLELPEMLWGHVMQNIGLLELFMAKLVLSEV